MARITSLTQVGPIIIGIFKLNLLLNLEIVTPSKSRGRGVDSQSKTWKAGGLCQQENNGIKATG